MNVFSFGSVSIYLTLELNIFVIKKIRSKVNEDPTWIHASPHAMSLQVMWESCQNKDSNSSDLGMDPKFCTSYKCPRTSIVGL